MSDINRNNSQPPPRSCGQGERPVVVYIVHGPFQLFNCCEARHRFHQNSHNILIFIDRGAQRNRDQTLDILAGEPFDEFHHIAFESLAQKQLYPFQLRALLRQIGHAKKVYVSLFRNISSHIINVIQPDEVVMYDDGNRTLKATRSIFVENKAKKFKSQAQLARLLGRQLDLSFTETATYFSLYDLPTVPAGQYVKNDYRYYKSLLKQLPIDPRVDFLGSKVIGHGIDKNTFEALMKEVVAFYQKQDQTLRYITHRSEPIDYLESISKQLGFELVNLDNIIEVAYARAESLPAEIATFRTAAVSNLHAIFSLPVRIFEMPQKSLEPSVQKDIQAIYLNFAEQGFAIEKPMPPSIPGC